MDSLATGHPRWGQGHGIALETRLAMNSTWPPRPGYLCPGGFKGNLPWDRKSRRRMHAEVGKGTGSPVWLWQ